MIQYEVRDGIGWILLNRPEKLNAMSAAFWGELRSTMALADGDDEVRAVVFHGAGRCFSVGADIAAFADVEPNEEAGRAFASEVIEALLSVEMASTPSIAAVHGYALGGGCELTMVCDLVVADETASFGTPEAAIGLVPGLGMLRARAHVNLHWLKYMVLTAQPLDARTAHIAGLVQEVVPPGLHVAAAESLALRIAAMSSNAVTGMKAFFVDEAARRLDDAVDLVAALQQSDDVQARVAGFTARHQ